MIIPWRQLSPDALLGLAEQYVHSASGEDVDDSIPLAAKVDQVIRALKNGDLLITWSELHQTAYLQPKDKLTAAGQRHGSSQ